MQEFGILLEEEVQLTDISVLFDDHDLEYWRNLDCDRDLGNYPRKEIRYMMELRVIPYG